ncbi:hypothetical protein FB45DRAFT_942433 [Roridomyces roridus]|uniref:Protein kinase domain-containing protein n=1 Tax=Roridomyces roridus TaxID=1738132 RepID=A0AAD7FCA6_9AGAR|nr:hypothetical protein FB45DRAFT_942433 [Roridomyces roridus]
MEPHRSLCVWKTRRRRRERGFKFLLPSSWIVAVTPAEFFHSQAEFPTIPLGDLYLSHEVGIARRRYGTGAVRRTFFAELRGSRVTAMTYEGEDAEQQWREEVSRYSQIRHPNIAQLFGLVHSDLKVAVFHGEMIPYKEVLRTFESSHFLSVYFWACMTTEFKEVNGYLADVLKKPLHWSDYTLWLRPGSLSLCLDLSEATSYVPLYLADVRSQRRLDNFRPSRTSEIISSLSHQDYHSICFWYLCQFRQLFVSRITEVRLGSMSHIVAGRRYGDLRDQIGLFPEVEVCDHGWQGPKLSRHAMETLVTNGISIVLLENGWTRVDSDQVEYFYRRRISAEPRYARSWLAHAHEIFDSFNITSGFDDYFLTDVLNVWLELRGGVTPLPPGYLLLCPLSTLRGDTPASFQAHLDSPPAYWSFDPAGNDRLTVKEAQSLGFPAIRVGIEVWGKFWDESVYAGIAEFQRANRFDSHDWEREYPPLDTCTGHGAPFALDIAIPKLVEPPKICAVEVDGDEPELKFPAQHELDTSEWYTQRKNYYIPWCDLEENLTTSTNLNVVVYVQISLIFVCILLSL